MSLLDKNIEAKCQDTDLQDALVACIIQDFNDGKQFALLKAGQRGGKTVVAAKTAIQGGFKNVALVTQSAEYSKSVLSGFVELAGQGRSYHAGVPPESWKYSSSALIVFDEAMWVKNSYQQFRELLEQFPKAKTLVISSRGPEYDADIRWRVTAGYSASAWDLNPNLTFKDLAEHYERDPVTFIRDYCGY